MSLAESHGFIMWPRCVRTFFPFSKPPWSWLASGYAGIHILPTRSSNCSQAAAHWNRQPVRENPTESPWSHRPRGGWKSSVGWCRKTRGKEESWVVGVERDERRSKNERGPHAHEADHRGLCRQGAEQWPLCVYIRRIISDKGILASSAGSRSLVATPPTPFPPLSLCLCAWRPLPRWKAEQIGTSKRAQEGEKQQRKVIKRKQWGLWHKS